MVRGSITTSLEFVVRNWFGLCQGGESSYLFGVGHRSWLHFSLCVRRWVFLFVSGPKVALFQFIVEIIFVCVGDLQWLGLRYVIEIDLIFSTRCRKDFVFVRRPKMTWFWCTDRRPRDYSLRFEFDIVSEFAPEIICFWCADRRTLRLRGNRWTWLLRGWSKWTWLGWGIELELQ